jgi:hypothetical protein
MVTLLILILFNLFIHLEGPAWGRLQFICFAICDRVNVGRQGLLEEASEGILELLDQR